MENLDKQNRYYEVDTTSRLFLEPNLILKKLSFFGSNHAITIKLRSSNKINKIAFGDSSFTNLINTCYKVQQQKLHSHQEKYLTPSFISELNSEVLDFCIENESLFQEFHESIKPQINAICKTLKR